MNEKFNTDFCKSGKVATEQLTKVLKSNDDLKKSDQAKSLEDFKIGVKKKLTYAVFESYNENTEFYGKILNDKDFKEQLMELIIIDLYRSLNE